MKRLFSIVVLSLVATTAFCQEVWQITYVPEKSPVPSRDTTKVLCIGNSFTYFFDSPHKMQEIAAFEGHWLDIRVATRGGWTFAQHIVYQPAVEVIGEGGYDVAFLQDQSQSAVRYHALRKEYPFIRKDFRTLADCVRTWSRDCRIVYERTWSYPYSGTDANGGFATEEEFDKHIGKGSRQVVRGYDASISPIGDAFALSRKLHPEIDLFWEDGKHQSAEGTYLKACVNYLILFRAPFGPSPSDCDLAPETARKIRSVAEKAVLGRTR